MRLCMDARQPRSRVLAGLAGLRQPTRYDIEDELPAFLQELGLSLPSPREAEKAAVDGLAREIVLGIVAPDDGAERMWSYANRDFKLHVLLEVFVGLAVERREENRPASVIDREIVEAAKNLLAGGGLRIARASA